MIVSEGFFVGFKHVYGDAWLIGAWALRQTPTYAAKQIELQNLRPERVRYLRKQAVFSQESFADLCELARTSIGCSDSPSGGQDDDESFRVSHHVRDYK